MICLVIAAVLILGGLFVLGIATLGIFRFESVLNRTVQIGRASCRERV